MLTEIGWNWQVIDTYIAKLKSLIGNFQVKHLQLLKERWGFIDATDVLQENVSTQQPEDFNKRFQKVLGIFVCTIVM